MRNLHLRDAPADLGDFNYDGTTNIGDFALLAANFNRSLAAPLSREAVPEPVGATALLLVATICRRRRGVDTP